MPERIRGLLWRAEAGILHGDRHGRAEESPVNGTASPKQKVSDAPSRGLGGAEGDQTTPTCGRAPNLREGACFWSPP